MKKSTDGIKVLGIIMFVIAGILTVAALFFGLMFGGFGVLFSSTTSMIENELEELKDRGAIMTYGQVVEADTEPSRTVVEYYVEEEACYYSIELDAYNYQYTEGAEVAVYYAVDNPGTCVVPDVYTSTFGFVSKVFYVIGAIIAGIYLLGAIAFLIAGIISMVISKKRQQTI